MKDFLKSRLVQILIAYILMFIYYKIACFETMVILGFGLIIGILNHISYKENGK